MCKEYLYTCDTIAQYNVVPPYLCCLLLTSVMHYPHDQALSKDSIIPPVSQVISEGNTQQTPTRALVGDNL